MIARYALWGLAAGVICIVVLLVVGWNPLSKGSVEDVIATLVPILGVFTAVGALVGWWFKRTAQR